MAERRGSENEKAASAWRQQQRRKYQHIIISANGIVCSVAGKGKGKHHRAKEKKKK